MSLRDAQEYMRNSLAFSARNEKAYVSKHIGDLLLNIDNIMDAVHVVEKLENRNHGESGTFGPFFHMDDG